MALKNVTHYYRYYSEPAGGGVQAHIYSLLHELKSKFNFRVVCNAKPGEPSESAIDGVRVLRGAPPETPDVTALVSAMEREKNKLAFLKEQQTDLLHVHGPVGFSDSVIGAPFFYPFYDFQAWTRLDVPAVFTFHGLPEVVLHYKYKNAVLDATASVWKKIEKKNIDRAGKVICVDKYVVRELEARTKSDKLVYIPNGVDLRKFRPMKKKQSVERVNAKFSVSLDPALPTFCYLNRLSVEKGIETVFRLSKVLEGRKFNFIICGDGPYRKKVAELCGKNGNFFYLGDIFYDFLPFVINASDFVINPLTHPATSRVNLETIACCRPPITTAIEDRYPVINSKTGYVYSTFPELALLMRRALDGKLTIPDFERNCRKAIKEFDMKRVAGLTQRIYKEVMDAK